jgi:hypothetical protein
MRFDLRLRSARGEDGSRCHLILLLIGAAFVAKFFWLLAAFAGAAAAGRPIGGWLARRNDREIERRKTGNSPQTS